MLRFLFWILILANGALLAFRLGYLDTMLPAKSEPQRMAQQLNADKIKLIPVSAPIASAAATAPTSTSAPASDSAAAVATPPPPEQPQKLVACTEVGDFSAGNTKKFEARLATLALGDRQSRRNIMEVASHMVFIPPQSSKEAADKKASELKNLGVNKFFIIQDNSKLRWGISLGVFKTEAAARKYLAELNKQGVRSARVGARSVTSSKVAYLLRDLDPPSLKSLEKIMSDFPEQRSHECGKSTRADQ